MKRLEPRRLAASLAVILPLFLAGCSGDDAATADPCKTSKVSAQGKTIGAARERAKRAVGFFKDRQKKKNKKVRFAEIKYTCTKPEPPKPETPPAAAEGAEAAPPPAEDPNARKERPPRPSCEVVIKYCPK